MAIFWAMVAGIGTVAGFLLGFELGSAAGYRDGFETGREKMRATVESVLALARAELLARDGSGPELIETVLALIRESKRG